MFSKALANDTAKEAAVVDFVNFATAKAQQLDLVSTLKRLPGTNEAFNDPVVTGDPILADPPLPRGLGTWCSRCAASSMRPAPAPRPSCRPTRTRMPPRSPRREYPERLRQRRELPVTAGSPAGVGPDA
ncbi:MAG: hypothetical protein U0869_14535 [Chloroflexota bacterium]